MNYWIRPSYALNNVTKIEKEYELIKRVCEIRNITTEQIYSTNRRREFVEARYIVFYVLKEFCGYSLMGIGDKFGKTHATVIHGVNFIKDIISVDNDFRSEVGGLIDFVRYNFQLPVSILKDEKIKSKYVGVSWSKVAKKWQSTINKNGKTIYLGLFKNEYEASECYQKEINKNN